MTSSNNIACTRLLAGLICFLLTAIVNASESEMSEKSTTTTTQRPESVTAPAEPTEAEVVTPTPKADSAPRDESPRTNTEDEKPTLSERVQIFIPSEEIDTEKAVAFPTNI